MHFDIKFRSSSLLLKWRRIFFFFLSKHFSSITFFLSTHSVFYTGIFSFLFFRKISLYFYKCLSTHSVFYTPLFSLFISSKDFVIFLEISFFRPFMCLFIFLSKYFFYPSTNFFISTNSVSYTWLSVFLSVFFLSYFIFAMTSLPWMYTLKKEYAAWSRCSLAEVVSK